MLVVPLLAGATGKADVKPLTYVSALMALAGVGLLVERGGVIMPNSGDIWSFASAVFFGIQVGGIGYCGFHYPGFQGVLPWTALQRNSADARHHVLTPCCHRL